MSRIPRLLGHHFRPLLQNPTAGSATYLSCESSAEVRRRVDRAHRRQLERFAGKRIVCNSQMGACDLRSHYGLDSAGKRLLDAAIDRLHLSARACGRILKIARTIADLDGGERILAPHVAESIQYRTFDRSP